MQCLFFGLTTARDQIVEINITVSPVSEFNSPPVSVTGSLLYSRTVHFVRLTVKKIKIKKIEKKKKSLTSILVTLITNTQAQRRQLLSSTALFTWKTSGNLQKAWKILVLNCGAIAFLTPKLL